jgi:hypothetical protein
MSYQLECPAELEPYRRLPSLLDLTIHPADILAVSRARCGVAAGDGAAPQIRDPGFGGECYLLLMSTPLTTP